MQEEYFTDKHFNKLVQLEKGEYDQCNFQNCDFSSYDFPVSVLTNVFSKAAILV